MVAISYSDMKSRLGKALIFLGVTIILPPQLAYVSILMEQSWLILPKILFYVGHEFTTIYFTILGLNITYKPISWVGLSMVFVGLCMVIQVRISSLRRGVKPDIPPSSLSLKWPRLQFTLRDYFTFLIILCIPLAATTQGWISIPSALILGIALIIISKRLRSTPLGLAAPRGNYLLILLVLSAAILAGTQIGTELLLAFYLLIALSITAQLFLSIPTGSRAPRNYVGAGMVLLALFSVGIIQSNAFRRALNESTTLDPSYIHAIGLLAAISIILGGVFLRLASIKSYKEVTQ